MTKMKRFVILQELPKHDTETKRANAVGKAVAADLLDRLAPCRVATNFQFVQKKKKIAKHNQAKYVKNKVFL